MLYFSPIKYTLSLLYNVFKTINKLYFRKDSNVKCKNYIAMEYLFRIKYVIKTSSVRLFMRHHD